METIGEQILWSLPDKATRAVHLDCTEVRKGTAHQVKPFMELANKVAELQFKNRDFVLLYRGQTGDFRNKAGNTSLKPTLLRAEDPAKAPNEGTLRSRFARLARAEEALIQLYDDAKYDGIKPLKRQQILRWSILQHYKICDTPLLDVTQSLRIAASFASDGVPHPVLWTQV